MSYRVECPRCKKNDGYWRISYWDNVKKKCGNFWMVELNMECSNCYELVSSHSELGENFKAEDGKKRNLTGLDFAFYEVNGNN